MVEHCIFFPGDERAALDLAESALDELKNVEVEAFRLPQKMESMRALALQAPQLRPKNGEHGRLITQDQIAAFLPIVAELRKKTLNKEFGQLLDRVYKKARKAHNKELTILLFR
jgi:hypothetical protein